MRQPVARPDVVPALRLHVLDRASLPAGFTFEGPAIVEEFGSTTVVFPGQHLTLDPHGILIIKSSNAAR